MPIITQKFRMTANDKKLAELILLVCARSEHDPKFGAIKLNKLLFHSDFSAYLSFGKAITGEEYFKLPQGPAPKRFLPISEKMKEKGDLAYKEVPYFGHTQKKPIALRQPDLNLFRPSEIDLVHKIIQKFWNVGASEISERSHGFLGWKAARDREIIPYSTALVGCRKPTPQEEAYGLELEPIFFWEAYFKPIKTSNSHTTKPSTPLQTLCSPIARSPRRRLQSVESEGISVKRRCDRLF